jgi:hypothetical protein
MTAMAYDIPPAPHEYVAAFGSAIWRQGAEGIGPMVTYLSAVVGACGAVAAWLWGK